jgi:hypothetical protein
MSRRAIAGATALLAATLLINVYFASRWGNGLSEVADPYSEANALRAGERFAKDGFTVNCGLPDVTYGPRFPGRGIRKSSGKEASDPVYHGYPPGADWLAGVYIKVFGIDHIGRFRSVPIAFGMVAAAVFLGALARTLGVARGLAVYLGCLLAPMFTNITHGLYYHGYAQSLMLLEFSALMLALRRSGPLGVWPPAVVFLIGFAQGWLSFDYCFVVTFAAVPLAFLVGPPGEPVAWRKVLTLVLAAGVGFTAAHALHFLQSVTYFGSLQAAVEEYTYRSNKRYGVGTPVEAMSKPAQLLHGLKMYGVAFLKWTVLFSPASIVVMEATAAVLLLSQATATVRHRLMFELDSSSRGRDVVGLALALGVSIAWLFAKTFHALNHLTFNGRHMFLFYFACCLVVARSTALKIVRERGVGVREGVSRDEQIGPGVEALAAAS